MAKHLTIYDKARRAAEKARRATNKARRANAAAEAAVKFADRLAARAHVAEHKLLLRYS